jgi:aminopeptidase N
MSSSIATRAQLGIVSALIITLGLLQAPTLFAESELGLASFCKHGEDSFMPLAEDARHAREACALSKEAAARRALAADRDQRNRDASLDAYDALYYAIELTARSDEESLSGSVFMQLESLQDGLDTLVYHAGNNLEILEITAQGQSLPFTLDGDRLLLALHAPLQSGDLLDVTTTYTATYSGAGVLSRYRTNVQTGETIHTLTTQAEPWDARHWWPCKDIPHDKADSMRIAITTDLENAAVCNGILEADTDNGDGTHTLRWFEEWPMVTYLLSMCVAPYNHIEGTWEWDEESMPMHDWSWGLSSSDQALVLDIGINALDALSSTFNTYPFINEKYGHAQYTWGGAMEHQSCSSMGFYNEAVIAHELAHQWFGDKITCDSFHHIWLNEGWATYSEALFFEYYGGEDALHNYMQYERYWGDGTIYVEDPETQTIFDGNLSYAKGSWVLHMLRNVMGDQAFWQAVRAYLGPNERAYHRTAQTSEFQAFMEAAHGSDLTYFFDQWIYGSFWPDYAYSWESYEDEGWKLSLNIIQQQLPEHQLFTMPIDVEIEVDGLGTQALQVFNDQAAQSFLFETEAEVLALELDPKEWILAHTNELQSMPETDLFAVSVHLFDEQGAPIEQIPANGEFTLRFILGNLGASIENAEALLESDLVYTPETAVLVPSLPFAETVQLDIPCSSSDANGLAEFTLYITWQDGEDSVEATFEAGSPEVLLIDADGGDTYESFYTDALDICSYYMTCTPETLPEQLEDFGLIVWMSGDARMEVSESLWSTFGAYIGTTGGHMVFTGKHFAESQDPTSLESVCGVQLINNQVNTNSVDGSGGPPFESEVFYFFNGGAGNQTDMDAVESMMDCSSPWLYYSNYDGGGSAAEEIWCGDGGVVTFGFGLEGISAVGFGISIEECLSTLIAWSRGDTALEDREHIARPVSLEIIGVFPNPFNPTTQVRYTLEHAGELSLQVFNLLGQSVLEQPSQLVPAGEGGVQIDASSLSSGVYLCQLQLQAQAGGALSIANTKILLLK